METTKRTVSWLTDDALIWAVAQCEGLGNYVEVVEGFKPLTDWAQGGAIIEREKIELAYRPRGDMRHLHGSRKPDWAAGIHNEKEYTTDHIFSGATPLEAAMRCYVASKLGNEIEIPADLDF